MTRLSENLYTASQVRELDRRVIEDHGVDAYDLMRRAGNAAFEYLRRQWPEARRIAVLAGRGNNGGDGYVIARLADEAGMETKLYALGDHGKLSGSARQAARDYRGTAIPFEAEALPGADVYVDAMLGTGLDRPLEGDYRRAVEALNQLDTQVFAVDVPTGLNADTGAVLGACVQAKVTASFIGLKLGLFTGEGPACAGRVIFDDLGAPDAAYRNLEPAARRITVDHLRPWLARRPRTAHKGHFGHVLVIGGDHGMAGAVRLAGEAALRSGAGLVSVATRPEHVGAVVSDRPELMVHGVESADALTPLVERATVLALGPGLGQCDWSRALWRGALDSGKPVVLDADGLNLLAAQGDSRPGGRSHKSIKPVGARASGRLDWSHSHACILTPHPGEAARLLDTDTTTVQADRPKAAKALAAQFGAVTVLKGAGSMVAAPGGELCLCDKGNPGMASGGMGDVLTGLIAGLAAQGLDPMNAACAGVWLHAAAADRAAIAGERGLIASSLFRVLRPLLNPDD